MSGLDVQAEVFQALSSLSDDLGESAFMLEVTPEPYFKPSNPWDPDPAGFPDPVLVPAMRATWTSGEAEDATLRSTDTKLMVAAGVVVLTPSLAVALDGKSYSVVKVEPFAPAGTVLYYNVFLRR